MAKKTVTYQVSMERINSFLFDEKKGFFRKPDFTRLQDPDYRKYIIRRTIIYLCLSVFCVAFLLLLSASTSPLYKDYCDGDSSIFMLIGKAMASGKRVYADYFDHKGPILFFINYLGFLLTGSKTGVFIIQCITLSLTAVFMYKTARIFTKTARSIICVVISILAFASTISDGNLSEEYCMLFCMIPVYLSIKFFTKTPNEPHPRLYIMIYGVCFALCAFIRVNNGILIGGIVLVALVTDFISDRARYAVKNIFYFLLGFCIIAVPVLLIFLIRGTLGEMLFATFIFNFKYAAAGSAEKNSSSMSLLIQWALPVLVLIIVSTTFSKRLGAKVSSLITAMSVFALIPVMLGFSYTHYYTTLIPLILIYAAVFFYTAGNRISALSVILCIMMIFPLYNYFATLPYNITHYSEKIHKQQSPVVYGDTQSEISYSALSLASQIPEEDKDKVFGYNVSAAWFLHANILPCYRLFTLQESWSLNYPEFGRQINSMMLDTPPKWVVIHNIDIIQSRQFLNIIEDNYELISQYKYDLLYKYKN